MNNALEKLKESYISFKKNNKSFKSKIPTVLTSLRAFSPVIIAPLILTGNVLPGLFASLVLASTDFFDGLLARKLNAESEFGLLLDPIVDKIFAATLILCGASINPILLINIAPEIAIAINNSKAFNENKNVNSSLIGKLKTWILSLNVLINLIPGLDLSIKSMIAYFTFGFQSFTYINYKKKNDIAMTINRTYSEVQEFDEEKTRKKVSSKKKSIRQQKIELLRYKKTLIENSKIIETKGYPKTLKKDN